MCLLTAMAMAAATASKRAVAPAQLHSCDVWFIFVGMVHIHIQIENRSAYACRRPVQMKKKIIKYLVSTFLWSFNFFLFIF